MILQELLKEVKTEIITIEFNQNIEILGITDNSKDVKEGSLFIAVSGYTFDGHRYIEEAVLSGAAAIIGEQSINNLEIPYIQVKNSRKVLGQVAKQFFGDPSRNKIMIGITGTNGKTTTSFMLKEILEESGISCSVIGTWKYIINGKILDSNNTTPGTIKLNSLLTESRDDVVIMEVSSHGLNQYRLEGIEFDYCIFTNLSHEHLDFHGEMENYFLTKQMLFEKLKPSGKAIINTSQHWGVKLFQHLQRKKLDTYTIGNSTNCDTQILNYQTVGSPHISVMESGKKVTIESALPGLHNLYNAVIAYCTARNFPINQEKILYSLRNFSGVPGRFEKYQHPNGSTIVVDYAHTADAISHTLRTAKEYGAKRIVHIFGFRGDRDRTKRTEMVMASTEFSDELILTMDDLNTEKYEMMVKELNKLHKQFSYKKGAVIPDRTLAIRSAIQMGSKDDWIIITGKGPEKYKQTFILPTMSDKETIQFLKEND